MRIRLGWLLLLALCSRVDTLSACSLCDQNFRQRQTFRQDARTAKIVLVGTLANPRLQGDQGFTDVVVEHVVQADPNLAGKKTLTLPRYVPIDPKSPPRYLISLDLREGKVDIQRGTPIQGLGVVEYLRGSLEIDDKDRTAILRYHFKYLDSADPDVAADAFLEFARASDQEISAVAGQLAPEKLRKLLKDPNTTGDRLGLFAYLLGACGQKEDAALFAALAAKHDERSVAALSGLLGGLIELNPDEGWKTVQRILQDPNRPLGEKLSAIGTIRFCQICKPREKQNILRTYALIVQDGEIADMAIEDLRRWQWWDLSGSILSQYGKKSHSAPLMKRCILRYALCCADKEAEAFVQARRLTEPKMVQEVIESLNFEKPVNK